MLVITDLHYVNRAGAACGEPGRLGRLALEWTKRAVADALRTDRLDVIVVLGDVVDDGNAPGAAEDMAEFAAVLRQAGPPVIAVPGNHDGAPERVLDAFGDRVGAHLVGGYCLYSFADAYAADATGTRPAEAIEAFLAGRGKAPVVTLQHNPLYPPVDCSHYPYMLTNTDAVLSANERRNVVLALSGHYHAGQELARRNGVAYFTASALSEAPFRYSIVKLTGRDVAVQERRLRVPSGTALVDNHIHTPFGYCAVDVNPEAAQERARALGLGGIVCVEHAGQLYLSPDEYWHRAHVEHPEALRSSTARGLNRMLAFRAAMWRVRSDFVRIGLEVECDRDGGLTLPEEDRDGWDVLLGAVHWLPDRLPASTPAQCARSFMRVVEQLLLQGIDVLAHPFRFLRQRGFERPTQLYHPLAKLLAEHHVKAEVNFHNNDPDPEFFRICVEQGVQLTLGSDAHELREVGDFPPHLRLLERIGLPLPGMPAGRTGVS
jgi:histidinol phosphatase-like PHP family hydrolase